MKEELFSNLNLLFPDPADFHVPNGIWYQQGALSYFARPVRKYLDKTFPGKWIGRREPLTGSYSSREYLKSKVLEETGKYWLVESSE